MRFQGHIQCNIFIYICLGVILSNQTKATDDQLFFIQLGGAKFICLLRELSFPFFGQYLYMDIYIYNIQI